MSNDANAAPSDRWQLLSNGIGIEWNVFRDDRLPHADHIEMSGRKVSLIVRYSVDAERRLSVVREVIWPTLRTREGDVRGYTRRRYADSAFPLPYDPGPVEKITFDGVLAFHHPRVTRYLFPLPDGRGMVELWSRKRSEASASTGTGAETTETVSGVYGDYTLRTQTLYDDEVIALVVTATLPDEPDPIPNAQSARSAWSQRDQQVGRFLNGSLRLTTPDPIINTAFAFAKLRAAESLFETQMGLVHSPGGGRYYGGVWANDQAEYSGPLFGFMNDPDANEAALNAYRQFARYMTPEFKSIPSSLEMEGTIPWGGAGDRGDAAMIAGGASRYALTRGDLETAETLWPIVQWCLEFCRRKTNADGVIASDSDELEGRFPTGDANLSTSCLAYDGLRRGADLARALGHMPEAAVYDRRADDLAAAIESYFGAMVEGYPTYRYYDGNTVLRAWICLPLVFDLAQGERKQGTIDALFSPRLWTEDGLATEAGDTVFWDRSTLYALRGVFRAGGTETAFRFLSAYTRRRLLGEHVPYPVEAHPEGGQAHLSAESALYCRIFTEGLLGITPTGLHSFTLAPHLPAAWPELDLKLTAFGHPLHIGVRREEGDILRVFVLAKDETVLDATGPDGTVYSVTIP